MVAAGVFENPPLTTILRRGKILLLICGHGGIGRLGGFRFHCQKRAGSSPVARTKNPECESVQDFSTFNETCQVLWTDRRVKK